jgi:hypothetical protein
MNFSRRPPVGSGSPARDDPADGATIRERLERTKGQTRASSLEHPFQQTSVHGAHELAMFLEEIPERTASQGDLHRPVPPAAESRIEAGFRQRLP